MKATGIVRRIDDLGRVVIPKEIRRTLRLHEATPLEIYTDRDGEIILKKYSPMAELGSFAKQYADALAQSSGYGVVITDRDQVVAVAGGLKKGMLSRNISSELGELIDERESLMVSRDSREFINVLDDDSDEYDSEAISTIISEGDAIGSVVMLSTDHKNRMGETEEKLVQTAASFLGKHMEG
ncbi:MAG: stage V sporulation protein T [Lachnospiraceae bacterium]|nr:stage V sporulation protein T [Lachnospiraceae bacterium]